MKNFLLGGLALTATLFLFWIATADAKGVAANGKEIARRVCVTCHVVTPDQKNGNDQVPTFMAIAEKYANKRDFLQAFLVEPHRPMPDLALTRQEVQDLIAYIESLR